MSNPAAPPITIISRYKQPKPLSLKRLKEFVALDNLTAQTPLIEVADGQDTRIWVAYDLTRTMGTFVEIASTGLVRTVTVYPSGERNEIINRPAHGIKRVRTGAKPHIAARNARRFKIVPKKKKDARA